MQILLGIRRGCGWHGECFVICGWKEVGCIEFFFLDRSNQACASRFAIDGNDTFQRHAGELRHIHLHLRTHLADGAFTKSFHGFYKSVVVWKILRDPHVGNNIALGDEIFLGVVTVDFLFIAKSFDDWFLCSGILGIHSRGDHAFHGLHVHGHKHFLIVHQRFHIPRSAVKNNAHLGIEIDAKERAFGLKRHAHLLAHAFDILLN